MTASSNHRHPLILVALLGTLAAPALARPCDDSKSCSHHDGEGKGASAHHGPRVGIHHLLEGVDLRPDQREATVQLHREAMADRSLVEATTKKYREELAKGVRAGTVDGAALEKLLATTSAELAALPPVHVKMLARLHAILDKGQRAQVAAKLAATSPAAPPDADKGDGREHGEGKRGHGGREHHHGGRGMHRFQRFAEDLDLTRAQREAIFKAFHDRMRSELAGHDRSARHHEMETRRGALAERFRADTFTVTDTDRIPSAFASERIAHLTTFAAIATPQLTVNQRLKFAEHIEAGRTDDEP